MPSPASVPVHVTGMLVVPENVQTGTPPFLKCGPAIATVLVCAFFTSFTGASGVTILALGGLLMPVLLAARYSEKHSLGLLTAGGSLGLLFPPSLPVILYGIVAHAPIDRMFLGGFLPGVLMLSFACWWGSRQAVARPQAGGA